MYQRTDSQLDTIADNIKANMYYQLQSLVSELNVGEAGKERINNMKNQSNILFVMDGGTINQRNSAANEAGKLRIDYKAQDGYGEAGYWNNDYFQ